jgi:hypothetical protein
MTAEEIEQYLREVNDELATQNVKGEICIYGGAVMCLVFKARPSTKDVDAIFEPVKFIRRAIIKIAERNNLPLDWLNYGVKMFFVPHEKKKLFDWTNLRVYFPTGDYLLAMKVLSARAESFDLEDTMFLIRELKLQTIDEVLTIVKNYYPNKEVKSETVFQLEEMFERLK